MDHEPMNHPQLDRILHEASHTKHIRNYHHGMTTGVGLMHRQDRDAVLDAYFKNGYHQFGVTVHGTAAHHDEIVRRKGAYDTTIAAAEFLKASGGEIEVSLMLNRFFAEDAAGITEMLKRLNPDRIFLAIPIFTPHQKMLDFESYRATLETFQGLRGYLNAWSQNELYLTVHPDCKLYVGNSGAETDCLGICEPSTRKKPPAS